MFVIDGLDTVPLANDAELFNIVLPVDTLPSVIVPEPFASIVRFSLALAPFDINDKASPPVFAPVSYTHLTLPTIYSV